ncbi:MAG: hypothetical protein HWE12_01630 [Oceanospirillaceae bacterium]|nr:hypothetical protein [Oceanospirillaceae bacterium]
MEEPIPPGDYDCCESGCEPCVWDVYRADMNAWREAQKVAKQSASNTSSTSTDDSQLEPNIT